MISMLVLTKDLSIFNRIKEFSNSEGYSCFLANEDNLILSMYKYNAKILIVDLDFCERTTINTIKDFADIEYIPMVGVYSRECTLEYINWSFIKYYVSKVDIVPSLKNIFNIFADFKTQYDKVKECNETIDIIDNEIERLFRNQAYSNRSIIQSAFAANEFLSNQPSVFVIFSVKGKVTNVDIYKIRDGITEKDNRRLTLEDSNFIRNNLSIETEFYSNCDKVHYSDVDNYKVILEKVLEEKNIKIENFAGYVATDTAVIAMNYEDYVCNNDAKIIKALCINLNLIKNVYRKIDEVKGAFIYTIEALARAGEAADDDTGSHIKRVNEYSKLISELLGMDKEFIEKIHYSAQMHDVGKIHIPHSILKKKGSLSEEEFDLIKQHTEYGCKIIGNAQHLQMASEIALNHHERFDGTGYPRGICGEAIPLSARIVSIADVYDALRNPRVYKPAFTHDKTVEIITKGDGRVKPEHFDPEILKIFESHHDKFDDIWKCFSTLI
jgi:HD-GYP domain-containing protein (c-di-GMP phosphodiesterase class II)